MAAQKLTARLLETLKPGDVVRDTVVTGLFAEGGKTGVSLKLQVDYRPGQRTAEARQRSTIKRTLGRYGHGPGEVTVEAARTEALRLLAEVKAGRDPRAKPARGVWSVERMLAEYVDDLTKRQKAPATIRELHRAGHYLSDWLALPITSVTREMARERHDHITREHGPVIANHVLKAFRTSFNFAKRVLDVPLGENPIEAVTFTPERAKNRSIATVDLGDWYARLQKLSNPQRRLMHEIGLFTGLRPGNLVALERGWIDFERHAAVIPAEHMKGRVEFHLPLSGHVEGLLRRAMVLSRELASNAPYLFPTRSADGKSVIATQVWKERSMPSETGHILRHTYSNVARLAGVDDVDRELLLAHKIPGVKGTYLHTPTLFERLLEAQERVTAHLLKVIGSQA